MTLSTDDYAEAILTHSRGLADAAVGRLDAPIEHCPGWTMADLVSHVTGVHWFWRTIVAELLDAPPSQERRPARASDDELLATFRDGAAALVETLRAADQAASCWTWAPGQQDVAFVTRHQVQEAAVHHWDAARAAGVGWSMDQALAQDAVEEFLTVSVSSEADPADPPRPALDGSIWLCDCMDLETDAPSWVIADGATPGTVAWHRDDANVEEPQGLAVGGHVDGPGSLLWLYGRTNDDEYFENGWMDDGGRALLDRFHALCYTD